MIAGALAAEQGEDSVVLGHLYARNKALALAIGAALTLRRRPAEAVREVDEHLAECERAALTRRGGLSEHFEACRDAAADLSELVKEVEHDLRTPSKERLAAVRSSHRRLRRLVWEVFDCEYVPCAAHDVAPDREPGAMAVADLKGASNG